MGKRNKKKKKNGGLISSVSSSIISSVCSSTSTKKGWTLEDNIVDKCGLCDSKIEINMPSEIWNQVMEITRKLDSEWLGYFNGTEATEDGTLIYTATELVIPEQEVTSAHVDNIEHIDGTIGVIHSHNTMGAFFSGTDDNYVNRNNKFSIVVNKKGEIKAVAKVMLPCSNEMFAEAEVLIGSNGNDEFFESIKDKIKEKKWGGSSFWKNRGNFHRGGCGYGYDQDDYFGEGRNARSVHPKPSGSGIETDPKKDDEKDDDKKKVAEEIIRKYEDKIKDREDNVEEYYDGKEFDEYWNSQEEVQVLEKKKVDDLVIRLSQELGIQPEIIEDIIDMTYEAYGKNFLY